MSLAEHDFFEAFSFFKVYSWQHCIKFPHPALLNRGIPSAFKETNWVFRIVVRIDNGDGFGVFRDVNNPVCQMNRGLHENARFF